MDERPLPARGPGRVTVSILIPVLNEEDFIQDCMADVLALELQDGVSIEALVIDGGSTDKTRELLRRIILNDPRVRLIENPARIQSTALNIGLREAEGDYILRLDAHSLYPRNYLSLCLMTARETGADNVGGVVRTKARGEGLQAKLVQALTTHRFGVGDASFRVDLHEGEVDTVPYGFFHRTLFERIGLFDERLVRAQDYEMNRRIKAAGGHIWMNPAIKIDYYQQPTIQAFLRKQFEKEAPYNAYLWYCAPYAFALRHAITAVFVIGLVAGAFLIPVSRVLAIVYVSVVAMYGGLAILSGVQQARRYGQPRLAVLLPPSFLLYHLVHGVGVLKGILFLVLGKAPVQKVDEPWTGAGRRHGLASDVALCS